MSDGEAGLNPWRCPVQGRTQVHLLGYMGAGKSTVGRLLARRLVWNYLDLDALIVRHEGRSIPEIFQASGEAAFRDIERHVLAQAVQKPNTVVALGGGTVLDDRNVRLCRSVAVTVWLRCPAEILRARIGDGEGRPLGQPQVVAARLAGREPAYARAADLTVDAAGSPEDVAAAVADCLESLAGVG